MWLLDTTTLSLHEFHSTPPPYAILSHTWHEDEVTFQEVGTPDIQNRFGWWKILRCCAQAKSDGLGYAWVDTCCINKSSSAELGEAINSMFRWYSEAHVCYAYLEDVILISNEVLGSGFEASRWFRRGWTLQELLAPLHVEFFDRDWAEIGTKVSLVGEVSRTTGIPHQALVDPGTIRDHTVAQRMRWASTRRTTKVEDMAYSLLGIFGVNMPLIYGEGPKAFRRLQLQILTESNDHSIFTWRYPNAGIDPSEAFSLLAETPAWFRRGPVVDRYDTNLSRSSITPTNIGLSMVLPITRMSDGSSVALLNCSLGAQRVGIYVIQGSNASRQCRARADALPVLSDEVIEDAEIHNVYMSTEMRAEPVRTGWVDIELSLGPGLINGDAYNIYCIHRFDRTKVVKTITRSQLGLVRGEGVNHPVRTINVPMYRDTEWLAIVMRNESDIFTLALGPKDGRIWSRGASMPPDSVVEKAAVPIWETFVANYNQSQEEYFRHFRDRGLYTLDHSHAILFSIKPLGTGNWQEYSGYKVEILPSQLPCKL
ncbi:hypothetical protein LTR10_020062 [Elasticomyces elasticus]|uniref:Heterokaryon incompatibility domain-containing protein n=1 Tax=Exophiala sideris TaxID=1016849 RepID=A0ABR0IVA7_9EURO|nr:hypothetical protein LTR10_020062 [Elasticomyces elasticus]KAK5021356.1 hypothetical protein LTS07_011099 [Exophiala sideris]KAK5024304.1 hypothetical protein LTR13_010925 [Exophiala sideris]KAK5049247.1 hypothetical protein LTR69_011122 [Exophiala sideris]KAK5176559.1 hypothetical protein LTR44_010947 [Eurotiomycetes sp. CCFEE 6388]